MIILSTQGRSLSYNADSSIIGVLLPPIDAGRVALYPSSLSGRPNPLKSIPAYGDLRMTGLGVRVIRALHTEVLFPSPARSSTDNASRTVCDFLSIRAYHRQQIRTGKRFTNKPNKEYSFSGLGNIEIRRVQHHKINGISELYEFLHQSSSYRTPTFENSQRFDILHYKCFRSHCFDDPGITPNKLATLIVFIHFPATEKALTRWPSYY